MKDVIRTILASWKARELPEVIDRDIDLSGYVGMKPGKIVVITGFRRVGKTYLVFGLIKRLLEGKGKEQVVYVNFEDERIPLKTEFLTGLLTELKQSRKEPEFLFLDEIQNIPNWSKWLRRVSDTEKAALFVTGSSSKMSGMEIPTELRGRFLEIRVFPLGFMEFLRFKGIKAGSTKATGNDENGKAELIRALEEYLEYGALPEVVLSREDRKFELLQNYYNTAFRRDIVERFGIRNEEAMKALLNLLLNSTAYSITRLYNNLKSLNHDVGKSTVQSYINYIENSYFMHSLPVFSFKMKNQMQYPRKVYFVDTGFINALGTGFSRNSGRLYENTVFMELKRRQAGSMNMEIYYWKDYSGKEVDFVIKEGPAVRQLIQVCFDVENHETKEREIKGLLKAGRELGCENLLVINRDFDGEEKKNGRHVKYLPLWKWLLKR